MRNELIVCNTFLLKNKDSEGKKDLSLPIIHYEMLLRVFLIRCWCGKTFFSQDRQPLVFALNFGLEEHQLSEFKGQWVVTCTIWFDESGITRNKRLRIAVVEIKVVCSVFVSCTRYQLPGFEKKMNILSYLDRISEKTQLEASFGLKDVEFPTFTIHLFKPVGYVEKSHFEI